MLNVRLEIERIDYERTLEGLLPKLTVSSSRSASPTVLDKLLTGLGPDAVPVAGRLLGYLRDRTREELTVWLLNRHERALTEAVNGVLEELLPGQSARIGGLCTEDLPGPWLTLVAREARADYASLLGSPAAAELTEQLGGESGMLKGAARLAMQMGSMFSPETLERQAITLLSTGKVKQAVLSGLSEGLLRAGVAVSFRDMTLESAAASAPRGPSGDRDRLPERLENDLIAAAAACLRDTVR